MIYVLCLNPAIDCYVNIENIKIGCSNRINTQEFIVGGKGINVCYILNELNVEYKLLTVLGGFTGQYIFDSLVDKNINIEPFWTFKTTRLNMKINSLSETSFDVNSSIDYSVILKIKEFINRNIKEDDTLIISGSGEFYDDLLMGLNCKIILDVNGKELKKLINYHPILVKPNLEEINEFSDNLPLDSSIDLLLTKGAKSVLLSMGENGIIYKDNDSIIKINAPSCDVITTVGCGDVLLATFVGLISKKKSKEEALKLAVKAAFLRCESGVFPDKKEIFF